MSKVEAGRAIERVRSLRQALPVGVEQLIDREVTAMQANAVQLAPKRTGNLAKLLGSPEAIEKTRTPTGFRWVFGFVTDHMRRSGFYAFWVEFGTKGYAAGDQRTAGVDKRGRQRFQKVKRFIPARRAIPFLRPAAIAFRNAIGRLSGVIEAAGGKVTITTKLRE